MRARTDLVKLAEAEYDLAIIGGGIIRTGVARDAAMRGLRTVLFEKEDFCYGTSGLKGAYVYYDSQIALTERLCMENVVSAQSHGALLLNHAKVVRLAKENNAVSGVEVKDTLTRESAEFRSKLVVNVGGPWLDEVFRSQA